MPASTVSTFADPYSYQAAVRAADVKAVVTARGGFDAKLMRVDLHRLWMQRGSESLPRTLAIGVGSERAPIFFLAGANQPAMLHNGIELSSGEIVRLVQMTNVTSLSGSWPMNELNPGSSPPW